MRSRARRVQALVALRLLEVLRDQDLPGELLEDENPSRTIPRRFGLSDVVERQIRTYREDARKGLRLPDEEVRDLFRFVIRRPDADVVFREVGRILASRARRPLVGRVFPKRVRYTMARGKARRALKKLFGRPIGGFGRGSFSIEGRSLIFVESDPDGGACQLLSGFCEELVQRTVDPQAHVRHTLCQARGDAVCRWEAVAERDRAKAAPADAMPAAAARKATHGAR